MRAQPLAVFCLLASGCDVDPPSAVPAGTPFHIVRSDVDPDGDAGAAPRIARDQPVGFEVDRVLAPRSANRTTVQITTGEIRLSGRVHYDPARHRVELVPDPGQMRPGLEYFFAVRPGLVAWDGVPVSQALLRRFVATDDVATPPPPATSPTLSGDVAPLLAARCATAGCHAPPRPVMALDLSTPAAIYATAVSVPARERLASASVTTERTDPHWGALLRVDPGTGPDGGLPAFSYLFYKIAGEGPLVGTRMPPADAPALTPAEVALVSDWIARGAPRD